MKNKTINWVGKQVLENSDELEEGCVEIVITVDDILNEMDDEDIKDYAKWNLNMRHEDDFESSLDDFSETELVDALRDSWYNFSNEVAEEEMVAILENRGYTVTAYEGVVSSGLDYVDAQRLEDIQKKFIDSSWDDKLIMYNKIFNL